MPYRVQFKCIFVQTPSTQWPTRNKTLIYDFASDFTAESTWRTLTDTAELTLPKNVYITDQNGKSLTLGGTNVNLGSPAVNGIPVFLRGDAVTIQWGYIYYDNQGNELNPMFEVFKGFIAGVGAKKPFVLKLEDNMYQLKQHQAVGGNNGFFSGKTYTVESMLREMIANAGLPFTVNAVADTSAGDWVVHGETIAQVLSELQKRFKFEAYFRGTELRVGSFIYVEQDAINDGTKLFGFEENIISYDLEYKRLDDLVLSAVGTNTIEEETGQTTRDGKAKTKHTKLQVLVTYANGSATPTVIVATPTQPLPKNDGGERRTFHFLGATDIATLTQLTENELKKYYYAGLRGSFTTFGMPFVKHGDNVQLRSSVLPEYNGTYKVREVKYAGPLQGLRQTIQLDYLIPTIL